MKLFTKDPKEEVSNVRRRLEDVRRKLTTAQNREADARDVLRNVLKGGEDSSGAEAALAAVRDETARATALEAELSAALEEAEARAAAASRDASLEELRATARKAMVEGEKNAAEAVKLLRKFALAWGEIERCREVVDRCGRLATKKHGAALGVNPTLPGRYNLADLAIGELRGGTWVREDLEGMGYFLPESL